jgi:hypothetical protein
MNPGRFTSSLEDPLAIRTARGARVVPPVADQVNASENEEPDQPVDACLIPSQPLAAEVLQRPIESAQYTSGDYATLAGDLAVSLSRGRTGQCWDNALAESFLASLKVECLDQQPWPTQAAARRATVEYIAWHNGTRLHSALGYMAPDEFETATRQEALTQVA